MVKDSKLYELLNISTSASDTEIRKAYHKLAKIHHPDKSNESDEQAEEKFKEIKFAYDVLMDKNKREIYDRYGLEGLKDGVGGTEFEDVFSHLFGGGGMGGMGGMGGFPFDLFGGGMMGGGRGGRQQKRRTQNMVYPLKVTLEELYNGKTKTIEFERSCLCKKCEGSGGKPGATKPCNKCNGRGFTMQYKQLGPGMVQQMQAVCRDCNGEGEIINEKDRCKECNGKKTFKDKKALEVLVEKGMHDSQKLTFRGESNQEPGLDTGDLIVVLQQEFHETFKRSHDDLYITHSINLTESLCGFKFVVKHLDGRMIVLDHPAGEIIAPGSIKGVEKEGMPIYKNQFEKGNLYVKFDVKFPESNTLSEQALQAIESILPKRAEFKMPTGEHVDEVNMVDYSSTRGSSRPDRAGASGGGYHDVYGADESDDDEEGGGGQQRVDCNTH